MNILEQAIFQAGYLEGLSGSDRALEDGDREMLKQCAETIRSQSAEVRECERKSFFEGFAAARETTIYDRTKYERTIDAWSARAKKGQGS